MGNVGIEGSLADRVIETVYEESCITRISGHSILVGKVNKTNVGIYVVDGDFSRAEFKKAVEEARAAGVKANRMYVYGRCGLYEGPAICFVRLEDIGIDG